MELLKLSAFSIFCYMNFWFLVSIIKKRNDVADLGWGLGFILVSWLTYINTQSNSLNGLIISILVTIWGVRLAFHIFRRLSVTTEDERYLQWRKEWGKNVHIRSYFQVYILQGFFLFLISLPITISNIFVNQNISILNILGIFIWIIGFLFESIGDYQLKVFKSKPENKGKLIQEGLWAYSRHPNYFGEATLWWGIWLISVTNSISILGIIGPITITYLLLKVSGVPMLEEKMALKPGFKEYSEKVSIFFPLPKRNKKEL